MSEDRNLTAADPRQYGGLLSALAPPAPKIQLDGQPVATPQFPVNPPPKTAPASPQTSLADVVSSGGTDQLVDQVIRREGHSPAGVVNNPGNIKFAGLPGQIDSGVKAADGGTFASYETPQAGRQGITDLIQKASTGTSNAYGKNPTVQSFMDVYGNVNGKANSLYGGGEEIVASGRELADRSRAETAASI